MRIGLNFLVAVVLFLILQVLLFLNPFRSPVKKVVKERHFTEIVKERHFTVLYAIQKVDYWLSPYDIGEKVS